MIRTAWQNTEYGNNNGNERTMVNVGNDISMVKVDVVFATVGR